MEIPDELRKMTIAALKKELEERGCSTKGCRLKLQYQERLVHARKGDETETRTAKANAREPESAAEALATQGKGKKKQASKAEKVKTAKAATSAKNNGKASSSKSSKSSSKRTSSFHAGSLAVVFLALLIGFLVYLTKEDLGQSHEKIKAVVAEAVTMAEAFLLSLKLVGKLASEFRNTFSPPEAAARVCKPHVQLSSVVFQNSVWRSWSKQVAESMSLPRDGDVPKGTAILLAKTPPVLTSVKEILEAGIEEEECKACIKEFSGKTGGNSKGEIQKNLATFLLECPYGVVVVEDVVTTELLPFHNAMSEQGGLTYNGTSIPGWHATYVLTMAMDESSDVDPSNEEECARTVKAGLVEKLTKRYTVEFANAFRRRIDYVGLGRN